MLLSDNQRENIRLNLGSSPAVPPWQAPEWLYFCSVFAMPSDRMCIQYRLKTITPTIKRRSVFTTIILPAIRNLNDPVMASTSCWVRLHIDLGLQDLDSSWSTATELWKLRARVPLSVRLSSCSGQRTEKSVSTMRLSGMMQHEMSYAQAMKATPGWPSVTLSTLMRHKVLLLKRERS
jgi:hypothetical protein